MNILILGGGGREHALAWAIAENPKCERLFAVPGNPGIARLATCLDADPEDGAEVVRLAAEHAIALVVIGPEAPLAAGVADALCAAGVRVVGPSAAAARLETSKTFTKEVCDACGAPTARWARFEDAAAALAHLDAVGAPVVVKADGLAAGKGVTVADDLDTARAAVREALGGRFGAAGAAVVIEEFMAGEEASLFVLADGEDVLEFGTAQDHKRALDGDRGPNTGGMGAYSPAPVMTRQVTERAMDRIVRPVLSEMARRGTPFSGVLYAGLMISGGDPRLVEFNVRLGDPEAQALMMRLGAQALDALLACAEGRLAEVRLNWAPDHALCVVMAAPGYPGPPETGQQIRGLDAAEGGDPLVRVFHAGTRADGDRILSAGGRVLGVTARGAHLAEAQARAYAAVAQIHWPQAQFRQDIGWRALAREG